MKSNIDFYIRQTAKQLLISESVVDRIIKDQWKQANKAAYQLKEVEVNGIGTFYPSPKKTAFHLKKLMEKHKRALLNNPEGTIQRFNTMVKDVEEKIDLLIKTKNYDKAKGYLEKQGIDIGRYKEQYFPKGRGREGSFTEARDL